MRAEALKGHLDAMLLAALEQGPTHGFASWPTCVDAPRDSSALESGTLYPALRRLRGGWP